MVEVIRQIDDKDLPKLTHINQFIMTAYEDVLCQLLKQLPPSS